jgi:hypothetical protein
MKIAKLNSKISFVLVVIILVSCNNQKKEKQEIIQTQYDIVKENTESYLSKKLNDPESYEFVELKLIDSVLYKDNIEYRKQFFIELRDETYPLIYKDAELSDKIQECNNILSEIDSIALALGEKVNTVASYTYLFSFRSTNSFGAKVLGEFILQTDPAPMYNIINMTDDKNKVLLNPNDFPGYKAIITKYNRK